MKIGHVDMETFNVLPLRGPKAVGLHCYSNHPSLKIHCIGYAINDGPPVLWIPFEPENPQMKAEVFRRVGVRIHWGIGCPEDLASCDQYRAHNAEFERVIGNTPEGQRIGFPHTTADQWVCTAAKCAAMNLPRALGDACDALETTHRKDETNKSSMQKLAKPRKPSKKDKRTRWTWENAFENYIWMYQYNIDDVLAERDIDHRLPDLPPREQKVYILDQKINDRGIKFDREAIDDALYLINDYKQRITNNCIRITGFKPTQRERLVEWLRENGCTIPDLQAPTIRDYLPTEHNRVIRQVLRIRQSHEMKAPSKYSKMLEAACPDDRLRGMFLYHGAATGRWASLIINLQNLFRGVIDDPDFAIAVFGDRDLDWLRALYREDPMAVFASCIRGMLVPEEGRILRCADYNSIEGRFTSWLAGHDEKLEIYATHGKVYEHTAAQIFQMDDSLEALLRMKSDHPDERFAGKTAELALGFQGAVAALNRMARKEGKEFEEDFALRIVRGWRKANAKIQNLWTNLEDHAVAAVQHPGKVFETNKLMFRVVDDFLYMRLPSGRRLAYYKPQLRPGKYDKEQVTYMGVDTETRQWRRTSTYGGRLTENAAQAGSRDILANGMLNLDRYGYNIIGTVHDEVIEEADPTHGSLDEMCEIMCDLPDWAEGLPVAADGWEGLRYKKD